jgi:hypothetical protein
MRGFRSIALRALRSITSWQDDFIPMCISPIPITGDAAMPVSRCLKEKRDLTLRLYGWGHRRVSRLSLNRTTWSIGQLATFPTARWFTFGFPPIEQRLKKVQRLHLDPPADKVSQVRGATAINHKKGEHHGH